MYITDKDKKVIEDANVYPLLDFYAQKHGSNFPGFNYATYPEGAEQFLKKLYAALDGEDLNAIRQNFAQPQYDDTLQAILKHR